MKDLVSKMKNFAPKFITFEGLEGTGKTTQSRLLYDFCSKHSIPVIWTREVGGTDFAEKVRDLLFMSYSVSTLSKILIVLAARYDHFCRVVLPALMEKKIVICDRFIDSTMSYQRDEDAGLDFDYFVDLHLGLMEKSKHFLSQIVGVKRKIVEKYLLNMMPDITFFLDMDPKISIQRSFERDIQNKNSSKIQTHRNLDFYQKIYDNFIKLSYKFKDRVIRVDCNRLDSQNIHKKLLSEIFLSF